MSLLTRNRPDEAQDAAAAEAEATTSARTGRFGRRRAAEPEPPAPSYGGTFVSRMPEPAPELEDVETEESAEDEERGTRNPIQWWRERQARHQVEGTFEHYPHLLALKPREKFVFRSDYFEVDSSVACVLGFFHDEAAHDNFAAFWGINRIPDGLMDGVTAVVLEQVVRQSDAWVDGFVKQSERLDSLDELEQGETGTTSSKRKSAKRSNDLATTIAEIQDGASYLSVHNRLFVKAPDLETLDETIERITRLYIDRFGTLRAAPYIAEQRQELSALLRPNGKKRGKGFYFTSSELAGSYSLVTNGLNDTQGELVGYMVGEINNSAVLMDVNDYEHHVVIADAAISEHMGRQRVANMWCSKISQATLLRNGRVVHLVLDGADLDQLGPRFERLTARVDLNRGDVNMFEMWGEVDDEQAIFSAQMEKLKLMFDQLRGEADGATSTIIRSTLEEVLTDFYVDQGMWRHNAKENREWLRVVGIPHEQVPRLQLFASYINQAHKAMFNRKNDPKTLEAYNVLKGIANSMLATNGDLFNNHTSSGVDGVRDARRVVYDFSQLMRRGRHVAMAQLVNIVGFAVGKLGKGDTLIVHGTEQIDSRVKEYLTTQFDHLHERGGRVVFSYNKVEKMLQDRDFNTFDAADYTLFGAMLDKDVIEYQERLHQQIPPDLAQLITRKGENFTYLRRGVTNVVFALDLALGTNPQREAQRRQVQREAMRAEEEARMTELMSGKAVPGANLSGVQQTAERDRDAHAEDGQSDELTIADSPRMKRSRERERKLAAKDEAKAKKRRNRLVADDLSHW